MRVIRRAMAFGWLCGGFFAASVVGVGDCAGNCARWLECAPMVCAWRGLCAVLLALLPSVRNLCALVVVVRSVCVVNGVRARAVRVGLPSVFGGGRSCRPSVRRPSPCATVRALCQGGGGGIFARVRVRGG